MTDARRNGGVREPQRDPVAVQIRHDGRARWQVALGDGRGPVSCETLEDARLVGYLHVAHARACELLILDADDRLIRRETIAAHTEPPARHGTRSASGSPRSPSAPNAPAL